MHRGAVHDHPPTNDVRYGHHVHNTKSSSRSNTFKDQVGDSPASGDALGTGTQALLNLRNSKMPISESSPDISTDSCPSNPTLNHTAPDNIDHESSDNSDTQLRAKSTESSASSTNTRSKSQRQLSTSQQKSRFQSVDVQLGSLKRLRANEKDAITYIPVPPRVTTASLKSITADSSTSVDDTSPAIRIPVKQDSSHSRTAYPLQSSASSEYEELRSHVKGLRRSPHGSNSSFTASGQTVDAGLAVNPDHRNGYLAASSSSGNGRSQRDSKFKAKNDRNSAGTSPSNTNSHRRAGYRPQSVVELATETALKSMNMDENSPEYKATKRSIR